jgi:NAD(P)-dependent dehydrogenase (short-subunit alcohol dehydrogenase family)
MSTHQEVFVPPAEARGEAPGRSRMVGRRILVVGAGQTDYHMEGQPIGNGRAISILLAREGAMIAACDANQDAVNGTVQTIKDLGGESVVVIADVRKPDDVTAMVRSAYEQLGGLDGVVYNVGVAGPLGLFNTTVESWDNTMNIDLRGAMLTAQAALPLLDAGSSLVFISSIAAVTPRPELVAYSAAKAGMSALMRDVAYAGRTRSIRANAVMIGGVDTGIQRNHARTLDPSAQGAISEDLEAFRGMPLGRRGTAWETAYAALFLSSNESSYTTGQVIAVDGGITTL